MRSRKYLTLLAALGCLTSLTAVNAAETISLGTGGITGVYYPVGGAICRLVNKNTKQHGIRCGVESTGGSVYNINTIRSGELNVAIAQSDVQWLSYNGKGKFEKAGPYKELRALFAVHPEAVTIIARKDANIKHVKDLVGKRVNIGNPGSGTEAIWSVMWKALGHKNSDLGLAAQMKSSETPAALCDNKIDAINWVAGHPLAGAMEAASSCAVTMVEVTGPKIDGLVNDNPYFSHSTIPAGMYKGTPGATKTFGVGAVFVTSTRTSNKTAYNIVKSVFENLDAFKRLHPALARLKKKEMISNSLSSPLHEGAIKYYKEAGLM